MYFQINDPMEYKVALYIRLSKEDDNKKESESVSNQRSMLMTFAKMYNLDVYDTYVDDGYSGTNFERPSFKRLIEDIESSKVDMVITKDMSRLGRDYIETGHYIEKYFPEKRVRYISILDNIDSGIDNAMNDITPFKAIMNDMYAKDISKKIKSVKEDKQKKGLFIGGKASYGYKKSPNEKNKIIIDEEAAEVVKIMFDLALEGKSGRKIAQILTAKNIPTPSSYAGINIPRKSIYSEVWKSEVVTFMLKNQVYIGNMVQGRIKKINYKSKKVLKLPREEWTVVNNTHDPIIDKEVFDKVQVLFSKRKNTRLRTYDYLLKGLVYCHECGHRIAVMSRTLSGNKNVLYFICRIHQRFTCYNKCSCHNIRVETVTDEVIKKIKEVCNRCINKEELKDLVEKKTKRLSDEKKTKELVKELKYKIDNLTLNLDKVYNDKLSDILLEDDFKRIYDKIKNERGLIEERLAKIQKEKDNFKEGKNLKIEDLLKKFLSSIEYNKELIFSLVNRIEITKDKEIIVYFTFKKLDFLSDENKENLFQVSI